MRIKMITLECGPNGNFQPGEERTVSEDVGRRLIESRSAIAVGQLEQAVQSPDESAVVLPNEAAVVSAPETRGRGSRRR